jgi:hypothetical protein
VGAKAVKGGGAGDKGVGLHWRRQAIGFTRQTAPVSRSSTAEQRTQTLPHSRRAIPPTLIRVPLPPSAPDLVRVGQTAGSSGPGSSRVMKVCEV